MNPRTLRISMIAAALLALAGVASPARADDERGSWRQDSREIRQDRRELRGDYRELAEDVADYRREKAEGDIAGMRRERMEIRQDKREIRRDQAELRHDLRDRRQDARGQQGHQDWNRHAGWNQDQRRNWGEQRHNRHEYRQDQREARHEYRHERAQGMRAQAVNWQPRSQAQAIPVARSHTSNAQQNNNGRHIGWQQGRGNPHRG